MNPQWNTRAKNIYVYDMAESVFTEEEILSEEERGSIFTSRHIFYIMVIV